MPVRAIDARLTAADSPRAIAQATADYYVQDAGNESCALAIVSPAGTVFACAGSATEHSLFRIASLSKLFLHPVLLKHQSRGRLDLDMSVLASAKLDLPPEYGWITLRDLLSSAADCATLFRAYWPIVDAQLKERDISAFEDEAVFGLLRVKVLPTGCRVLYRSGKSYGGASFVGFDLRTRTAVVILRNVTSWPDRRVFAVMDALRGISAASVSATGARGLQGCR